MHEQEVLEEVRAERARQDAKWGGPEHDDGHEQAIWVRLIDDRLAYPEDANGCKEYRQDMIEIAALAVAAVESFDRKAEQQ